MLYRLIIILYLSSISLHTIEADEIAKYVVFENYSSRDGLQHPDVSVIFEDKNGFIWLGTAEGLVRFDGTEFVTVRQDNFSENSVSDNTIYSICSNSLGDQLWVGTAFGGLNRVNKHNFEVTNFLNDSASTLGHDLSVISALHCINDDLILIGTYKSGLFKFIPSEKRLIPVKLKSLSDFDLEDTRVDVNEFVKRGDDIFVATSKGLLRLSATGDYVEMVYRSDNENISSRSGFVMSVQKDKKDNIYFVTRLEVWKYDSEGKLTLIDKPELGENHILTLDLDWNNNIWYGTNGNGLHYINTTNGSRISYSTNNKQKFGIQDNAIDALAISKKQSIVWIGTKSGFSKLDLSRGNFEQHDITEVSGSANVFITYEDSKKGVWFWTPDGLFRKGAWDLSYRNMKLPISNIENIFNMVEYDDMKFLLSSSNGLYLYDFNTGVYTNKRFTLKGVNEVLLNIINHICHYHNDVYLLTTNVGVIEYNIKTGKTDYHLIPKERLSHNEFSLSMAVVESDSVVWMGSRESLLVKLNPIQSKYSFYSLNHSQGGKTRRSYLLSLALDKDSNLWVATYGDGLLYFNTKTLQFSQKYARDVLNKNTYAVIVDSTNRVWVSTNYGIARVSPLANTIEPFGQSDGTFCSEFNEGAFHENSIGEIYFGGTNGFIKFNPYEFKVNTFVPPVLISKVYYGGESVKANIVVDKTETGLSLGILTLPRDKKKLVINLSVLNFSGSQNNKIAWKLENFDADWNYGYPYERIVYLNLPQGKYKLLTKGANDNNVWNEKGETLDIVITAPFYTTPLAWVLFFLLFLAIASLVVYFRFRWEHNQQLKLEQLVKSKTADLEKVNDELEINKIEILSQKGELELHRNYLEEIVEKRTADLEKAKLKAEESDKLKTAFLANLSHEIRTPMNAIIGFSSLLNTNSFSLKEQKEFINLIMASSETLLVLIDDILDISRIETSQISINPTEVRVGSFTNQLFQTLTFENTNPATEFLLDVDKELNHIQIKTDPTRLKQIITNLSNNALKFTKRGYVKITAKKEFYAILKNRGYEFNSSLNVDDEILFFSVEDTGIGIEPHNLEVIFEPFRKLDSPKKEIYGGVGLGLSIVKKLVIMLGGEIQVRSVINEGSTFYFYLPLNEMVYLEESDRGDEEDDE